MVLLTFLLKAEQALGETMLHERHPIIPGPPRKATIQLDKHDSKAHFHNETSTQEEQNQAGNRECACCAISCFVTKPGKQVPRGAPRAPKGNLSI